jgi:hypothetical protein
MINIGTNTEADDTKTFDLRYLESVIGNLIESGLKIMPVRGCMWTSPI